MGLKHILLGLLIESASGYDLKRMFDSSLRHFWAAKLSQIYPTLQRMEVEGLLTSDTQPSELGPDRRVYTRTPKGKAALLAWFSEGPELSELRLENLAKLFHMWQADDLKMTLNFLEELNQKQLARQEAYQMIEKIFEENIPGFPDQMPIDEFHYHMTLRRGQRSLQSNLEWCEECINRVKERLQMEARDE